MSVKFANPCERSLHKTGQTIEYQSLNCINSVWCDPNDTALTQKVAAAKKNFDHPSCSTPPTHNTHEITYCEMVEFASG